MAQAQIPVGFYTDTSVCIGCKACQVACHQWNDLPAWTADYPRRVYSIGQRLSIRSVQTTRGRTGPEIASGD